MLADGEHLDGIIFNSSKRPGGKCYTLFLKADDCADTAAELGKTLVLTACRKTTIDFAKGTYA